MFGRKRSPGRSSSPTGKGKAGGATGDKKTLKSAEIKELVRTSVFDQGDINALNEVYHRHTTGENSTIPIERMRDIPETSVFPLFQRVVQMKNTDLSGDIDFAEFVQAMSSLSPRATLEEKLRFVFALFDMNDTGLLESLELFQLLRMTLGTTISDRDLQGVCDSYMQRFPNGMTFDAFTQMVDVADLNKLTLNLGS